MLQNTFIHLPNFTERRERRLWRAGIMTWEEFLDRFSESPMHVRNCAVLETSRHRLRQHDANFFADVLPRKEHWRAFKYFPKVAYVDIETTGLSATDNDLTVVGLFDGKKTHSYIAGKNLEDFREDIEKFEKIVTFNGAVFDLPFLMQAMPGIKLPKLHTDLRFTLNSLGIWGGLKSIEQQFGFEREGDLKGLGGYDAVKMWQAYVKNNDKKALDRLVRYNAADIANLQILMEWAYKKKKEKMLSA